MGIRTLLLAVAGLMVLAPTPLLALDPLGLPVDCVLGEGCFLQQLPDMDPGPEAMDPWCTGATYDGHEGTDIRVRSLADMAAGTPVIASAAGTVRAVRDGVADHLVQSAADRAAVEDIECGNGVLVDNGDGWQTQYCHLRRGSVTVERGQSVARGDVLGEVGASGLAQFPHVHLAVRKDGEDIDPFTGRPLGEGCAPDDGAGSLWDPAVAAQLQGPEGGLLDLGFAGAPLDYDALVVAGAPPEPTTASGAFVAWAWFYNLRQGDLITVRLEAEDGTEIAETAMEPLDRNKAVYAAFAGKRRPPAPGTYRMRALVERDGTPVISAEATIAIR